MKLIVISGAEATCKSSIGKELAKKLGYQYQSKDTIKEVLFDTKAYSTWNFKWYEQQAKMVFFRDIEKFINNQNDAIIESNFIGEDKTQLAELVTTDIELIEIHCSTRGYISFRHFVERNESRKRHPGHHDRRWYPKVLFQTTMHILNINIGAHNPVGLSTKIMNLDTTHFPSVDYKEIIQFINS